MKQPVIYFYFPFYFNTFSVSGLLAVRCGGKAACYPFLCKWKKKKKDLTFLVLQKVLLCFLQQILFFQSFEKALLRRRSHTDSYMSRPALLHCLADLQRHSLILLSSTDSCSSSVILQSILWPQQNSNPSRPLEHPLSVPYALSLKHTQTHTHTLSLWCVWSSHILHYVLTRRKKTASLTAHLPGHATHTSYCLIPPWLMTTTTYWQVSATRFERILQNTTFDI